MRRISRRRVRFTDNEQQAKPCFRRGRKLPQCIALRSFIAVFAIGVLCGSALSADNWTRFRGENGEGIVEFQGFPTSFSVGDFSWNVELPGYGHSSPIVWNDSVFVTSAIDEGAVRYLHHVDARTGTFRWTKTIGLSRSHKHNKNSWASSTPTTDGKRVYVAFADDEHYTLSAYDFDGALVWRRLLGQFESQHGQGASPILFENMVIIPNDQLGPSSVMAFDRETGNTVWSVLRDVRRTSYATPIIIRGKDNRPQLICLSGAMGLTSLDPYTGQMNWISGQLPLRTVASPVFGDGLLFASCGSGGVGKFMIAVDPNGHGEVGETHIKYERKRILPYVPTPIAYKKHTYLWNDNGVVSCVETATGKNIWTNRIGGNFSGSPICVDGNLYCLSEEGVLVIVAAKPEYKLLGKVELGDGSHATPAFADGKMYLRTFHRLACMDGSPSN